MKRTSRITLLLMGTASLALTACGDDATEAGVFSSIEECISSGIYTEQYCKTSLEEAVKRHTDVAPRYKSKEDCEADFGPGQCQWGSKSAENNASNSNSNASGGGGGDSVFMPLMMGFMVGQMLGNNNRSYSEPLYRPNLASGGSSRGLSGYNPGSFRTSGNVDVGNRTGVTSIRPSILNSAPARSPTLSRGGFGASAAAIGTGGS